MPDQPYRRAIAMARRFADAVGTPLFYQERTGEVARSRALFSANPLIATVRAVMAGAGDLLGHGLHHGEKVAIDSGALVLIEAEGLLPENDLVQQVCLAQLAGLLHDIRRQEKDHARKGAETARMLLASFPLALEERTWITDAIGNHEAFRSCREDTPGEGRLLSDALYDADKFRWGPDNFTETLWAMVIPRGVPLSALLPRFPQGLERIRQIRESFRTMAGKRYGPDFIDRGLEIGRRLQAALLEEEKQGEWT